MTANASTAPASDFSIIRDDRALLGGTEYEVAYVSSTSLNGASCFLSGSGGAQRRIVGIEYSRS